MKKEKNKAAQQLALKKWRSMSRKKIGEHIRMMNEARLTKKNDEKLS